MVEAVELAEEEVGLDVVRLELDELLVLADGELQHLSRLLGLHVAERAEIDLAEQRVRLDIGGVLVDLILRGGDGLTDAAEFEVEVGETILQER